MSVKNIHSAVIVAGGSGSRFETDTPKQFAILDGIPVLMHTLNQFEKAGIERIILVLPLKEINEWKKLIAAFNFNIKHEIVEGGITRFDSVRNGLSKIESGIVAIHDGVRPFCTSQLITNCFAAAAEKGNAVPAITVADSVRQIIENETKTIDRNWLRIIQTPQVFEVMSLKRAYKKREAGAFTDDASVFEADGNKINLIEGERTNIKITFPVDLETGEGIIRSVKKKIK